MLLSIALDAAHAASLERFHASRPAPPAAHVCLPPARLPRPHQRRQRQPEHEPAGKTLGKLQQYSVPGQKTPGVGEQAMHWHTGGGTERRRLRCWHAPWHTHSHAATAAVARSRDHGCKCAPALPAPAPGSPSSFTRHAPPVGRTAPSAGGCRCAGWLAPTRCTCTARPTARSARWQWCWRRRAAR